MTRVRVVIQARLNSSRLPGKMLLPMAGMPLIELVARRASRSGHEVVVATSSEQYDALIERALEPVGIRVVRGSLDDVLGRFVQATEDLDDNDIVVRLTGDNPVADADLVDELLAAMAESGHTYGRVDIDQVPEGFGAEAFPAWALRQAAASTQDAYDREHVTPWLRREFGELLFVPSGAPRDVLAYRATCDCLDDYRRLATLFEGRADAVDVPLADLMADLVTTVEAAAPRARQLDSGFSEVVLSLADGAAKPRDDESAAEQGERLRLTLSRAVAAGVSHLEVDSRDDSPRLAQIGLEPALTRRIRMIATVALKPGERLSGVLERVFAQLGRRGVDTLVFADVASAQAGWSEALRYLADGLVSRIGVDLAGVSTEDLAWVFSNAELGLAIDPPGPVPERIVPLHRVETGSPRLIPLGTVETLNDELGQN